MANSTHTQSGVSCSFLTPSSQFRFCLKSNVLFSSVEPEIHRNLFLLRDSHNNRLTERQTRERPSTLPSVLSSTLCFMSAFTSRLPQTLMTTMTMPIIIQAAWTKPGEGDVKPHLMDHQTLGDSEGKPDLETTIPKMSNSGTRRQKNTRCSRQQPAVTSCVKSPPQCHTSKHTWVRPFTR